MTKEPPCPWVRWLFFYGAVLAGVCNAGIIQQRRGVLANSFLAFAMRPGTEIDSRLYTHRRKLTALSSASPDGLYRLRLDLEDLARAQEDLADLRIVDAQSRQWAYLLERNARRVDRACLW